MPTQTIERGRAVQAIMGTPWAILPESLAGILSIADRGNEPIEAVEQRLGRKLDNTRTVTVRDGVAIIPVIGPIMRYANLFSAISGGTSIQVLATDFTEALDNPNVNAILFEIDSPGGAAMGLQEFADMIFAARGRKPMKAYVGGYGASAAYWIASAADEVVAAPTSIIGSIGVVTAWEKPDAKTIEIVSSRAPNKRPDVTTDTGRAQIQNIVDALEVEFIDAVARNRAVSADTVENDFGQGGVFVGKAAIAAGLADRIGTLEGLISEMAGGQSTVNSYGGNAPMSTQNPIPQAGTAPQLAIPLAQPSQTVEAVNGPVPTMQPAQQVAAPAIPSADPVVAERNRVLAIQQNTISGNAALAHECIADGSSVEAFLLKQTQVEMQKGSNMLATLQANAPQPVAILKAEDLDPTDDAGKGDEEGGEKAVDAAALKATWKKDKALQAEFTSFDNYLGYEKAKAEGRVK